MEKIVLDIHEDVVSVVEKIRGTKDSEIEIDIPEGSVLFENSLNLKLIKKKAEKFDKEITFHTTDPDGLKILSMIDEGATSAVGSVGVGEDFVSREVSIHEVMGKKKPKKSFSFGFLKSLSLPSFNFSLPEFNFDGSGIVPVAIVLFLLAGIGFGAYKLYWSVLKAEINVVVESQPLVESVQIRVGSGLEDNLEEETMRGKVFAASTTKSKTTETTGTEVVGEKAEGRIEIINKTTAEKTFEEGTELYPQDDDDIIFLTQDGVTVPPAEPQDPADPGSVLVPGKKEVDVIAEDMGSSYNIDSGKVLEFEEYPSTDYVAEVVEDIDDGYMDTISIVAQKDVDSISEALLTEIKAEESGKVENLVEDPYVYINNSQSSELTEEEFDHQVGDEADEVTVTQSVIFKGLSYDKEKLADLLEPKLVKSVPEGFELSSEEIDINVEILGNTNETVLSTNQADLQVTIKSYVIPEIHEEEIKEDLIGVSIARAKEILNDVPNANNFSLGLNYNIPLLNRMPRNPDNISINIERE